MVIRQIDQWNIFKIGEEICYRVLQVSDKKISEDERFRGKLNAKGERSLTHCNEAAKHTHMT
jgi:hypothetical protein